MPWQANAPQAGFSSANHTWLKRDPAHAGFAVDRQAADPHSTLHYTRALLRIRKQHPALASGDITLLDTPEAIVAFVRREGESAVLCAFNLGEEVQAWTPPDTFVDACVLASESALGNPGKPPMVLAPGSGYWAANNPEQA
jgi:alpha-glucosidase